MTGGNPS